MLTETLRSLWSEPRAPGAPARVGRDWLLVGALSAVALIEGALRPDVAWRPVAIALALALASTLLWRRTHPLTVVSIAFGLLIALNLATAISAEENVGLYSTVFVIVLPYALFRWGSGREVGLGLAIILTAFATAVAQEYNGVGDTVAAAIFLLFPAAVGAAVRYGSTYRMRERDEVRFHERQELARELHDTVAHHVSAIAVRAQAGRVVAQTDPQAAVDALEVIEGEASRALREMRLMVGVLRDGDEPELGTTLGLTDVPKLAAGAHGQLPVSVDLSADLGEVEPAVGTAAYRIAQESVTNAVRHSRQATHIDVTVRSQGPCIQVSIVNDGAAVSPSRGVGYGIVGMTERAELLGGTLQAGPQSVGGWSVVATLPRGGGVG